MNKMILETNVYCISELPIVYMVVVITKKGLGGNTGKLYGLKEKGHLDIIINGVEVGMLVFTKQTKTFWLQVESPVSN